MRYRRADKVCKWSIYFTEKGVEVKTIDNNYNGGFGSGVRVDGFYPKTSSEKPKKYQSGMQETNFYYFK